MTSARSAMVLRLACVMAALGPIAWRAAHAQEFAGPQPAWPPLSSASLLEHGLPHAAGGLDASAFTTRWYGLPELVTRTVALGAGWRALRLGLGVSQTGEPDLGWTALALGAGAAGRSGGAGVRVVARRDRVSDFRFDAPPGAAGVEVGAGVWLEAGEGVRLWASAPQLETVGAAPPLRRSLAVGGALELGELRAWLIRRAVPGVERGLRGEHVAGAAIMGAPLGAWLEVEDQPLRGGFGVVARLAAWSVSGSVSSHPVLGETFRAGIAAGGGR
ncbi:MAG TPA: hypothetical protein VEY91_10635 [Candidatus Limnocylindria bacterium]|nr:hypothetical protein [Candidatus Limnocylindria bacterium]